MILMRLKHAYCSIFIYWKRWCSCRHAGYSGFNNRNLIFFFYVPEYVEVVIDEIEKISRHL